MHQNGEIRKDRRLRLQNGNRTQRTGERIFHEKVIKTSRLNTKGHSFSEGPFVYPEQGVSPREIPRSENHGPEPLRPFPGRGKPPFQNNKRLAHQNPYREHASLLPKEERQAFRGAGFRTRFTPPLPAIHTPNLRKTTISGKIPSKIRAERAAFPHFILSLNR